VTTSTSSTSSLVVNGLISGINTQQVIAALLQGYAAPITDLQNQQNTLNSKSSEYQNINNDMQGLLSAAQALSTSSAWNLMTSSSSNTAVATATSQPGAQPGTATFTVDQLAQGNVLASKGGVSSTGAIVTSASSMLVGTGGAALGFSGLAASGALALGAHAIDVTQSSSAASVAGTTQLGASTVVTAGSNDTLNLNLGGTAYALTLAPSSTGYTPAGLVAAINTAASSAGAGVTASLSSTGELQLASNEQGSNASLSITGGNALTSLGLTSGQSGTGTDAVVTVDGVSTTLSAINPGQQVNLAAATGSITATLAATPGATGSLVTAGTSAADLVSTGSGSLSDLVSNINGSGLALTASAVQNSAGQYLLQVSANGTGLVGSASVDGSSLAGGALAGLSTISQAQDALVNVGGVGGYQIRSSTDVFSNLMAGTAVTVASTGQSTVTVSRDAAGEAAKVKSLVGSATQVLDDINQYAGYNAATKTGGPLMGSSLLSGIQQQVLSVFASAAGTSGLGNSLAAGISLSSTGTVSFDQTKFETAFTANPSGVESLFTQGGSFAPSSSTYGGTVGFVFAGNNTLAGSYDVQVSQSATQASDLGSALSGGAVSAAENLTVAAAGQTATYAVSAGESLTSIAAGLNQVFASGGLGVTASVLNSGTQLEISSSSYGSGTSFQVTSSNTGAGTTGLAGTTAGAAASFAGTDVAGTINGVAAVGSGQVLSAPTSDPILAGLALKVSATGITSTTDLGSFIYTPGLAQQIQSLANSASDPTSGTITSTIKSLSAEATGLNGQITNYQQIETSQQTLLQNEFATMETTLGSLKNEASQITSAIAQLP
jgi:flagellar hook-associated protein 2